MLIVGERGGRGGWCYGRGNNVGMGGQGAWRLCVFRDRMARLASEISSFVSW